MAERKNKLQNTVKKIRFAAGLFKVVLFFLFIAGLIYLIKYGLAGLIEAFIKSI